MLWEDERYVRLYVRDTADWLALSFEAQGLLALILRKLDRGGYLSLGRQGRKGVFIAIGHAHRAVDLDGALQELLDDGCLQIEGAELLARNFEAAQTAHSSNAKKCREYRARHRAESPGVVPDTGSVTDTAGVTGDTGSVATDTPATHSTVLCCAGPNQTKEEEENAGARDGLGAPDPESSSSLEFDPIGDPDEPDRQLGGAILAGLAATKAMEPADVDALTLGRAARAHGVPADGGQMIADWLDAKGEGSTWLRGRDVGVFIAKDGAQLKLAWGHAKKRADERAKARVRTPVIAPSPGTGPLARPGAAKAAIRDAEELAAAQRRAGAA